MTAFQRAAIVMWFYAVGFGLSTIPVAIYLRQRGRLPSFFGLFEMYGGPWSTRLLDDAFVLRLMAFLVLMLVVAFVAWLTWNGSKLGAVLSLALLPIEVVFWIGFALPIPWLLGAARLAPRPRGLEDVREERLTRRSGRARRRSRRIGCAAHDIRDRGRAARQALHRPRR